MIWKTLLFRSCIIKTTLLLAKIINKQLIATNTHIITARKRSLGQGNMFTGVCLSTGGCLVWGVSGLGGVPGEAPPMATAAGGTQPTGMHSCLEYFSFHITRILQEGSAPRYHYIVWIQISTAVCLWL